MHATRVIVYSWLSVMVSLTIAGTAIAQTSAGKSPSTQSEVVVSPSGTAADLAKKLSNPIASLISVPIQLNWDEGIGSNDEGRRFLLNFQPVMPFDLNQDWTLITRVIMPIIAQPALFEGGESSFGMGDLLVSMFFSPHKPGLTWGVGPVFSLPVTSDPMIGSGKYGLGPTAVLLQQSGKWTFGALVNQVWSVGGDENRAEVNTGYFQPFLVWGENGWTIALNTESSVNWDADTGEEWTVPINIMVNKVTRLGMRPISLTAGPRFYLDTPTGGPDWGFRLGLTLVFPAVQRPQG